MTSANGFELECNGFTLAASWRAPYFVLSTQYDRDSTPLKPLLYHAETFADAVRVALHGGIILNATFERYHD